MGNELENAEMDMEVPLFQVRAKTLIFSGMKSNGALERYQEGTSLLDLLVG